MLEILYDLTTLEVRAWNSDEGCFGHLHPTPEQAVVIWNIDPPSFYSLCFKVDLATQQITGDEYIDPLDADIPRILELLAIGHSTIPVPLLSELVTLLARRLGFG